MLNQLIQRTLSIHSKRMAESDNISEKNGDQFHN
jgi:hypothetical protein